MRLSRRRRAQSSIEGIVVLQKCVPTTSGFEATGLFPAVAPVQTSVSRPPGGSLAARLAGLELGHVLARLPEEEAPVQVDRSHPDGGRHDPVVGPGRGVHAVETTPAALVPLEAELLP